MSDSEQHGPPEHPATQPEGVGDAPRARARARARRGRILNNLPLAHRLAAARAATRGVSSVPPAPAPGARERLLGQALIGLVAAADSYDEATAERFSAFAEPRILSALDHHSGEDQIAGAQREVAAAISSQRRVRELADFLDVPVQALVGGLMDAALSEPGVDATHPLCRAAPDPPGAGAGGSDDVLRMKSRTVSYRCT